MSEKTSLTDASSESLAADVIDEITEQFNAGQRPDLEEYITRYPNIESTLREVFGSLLLLRAPELNGVASAVAAGESLGQLGEYRVLREIGRGGMGIVYEAEQQSLGRRVALKVFPFSAVWNHRQLQRFKNEAQAAASLKHPNIVHVYAVGCQRAVHFYAMEYIEGKTIARVIDELRGVPRPPGLEGRNGTAAPPAREKSSAPFNGKPEQPRPAEANGSAATSTEKHSLSPTETERCLPADSSKGYSVRGRELFRTAAEWSVQAADALEHAHQMGVVHRDIKPSNLLLDAAGHLSITDFGLAMTPSAPHLTMTGDLLGTLRYMSPEQVRGKSGVLDHRTDVYSLGITLYEMLTLRPAFEGNDRQELMQRIAEAEPRSPRQVNRMIPRDLETIVLKAIAKEPAARYATADELAADLRRFLEDKPILAKRPSLLERAAKWSRRHRPIVWSAAAVLLVATLALSVSTILIARAWESESAQRDKADKAVGGLLDGIEATITQLAPQNRLKDIGTLVDYAEKLDEQLPVEVRNSPRHRSRLASMHYQCGWGSAQLGDYDTAERALRAAIDGYEKLSAEEPKYELLLARCNYYLSDTLRNMNRLEEADDAYGRALQLLKNAPTDGTAGGRGLDRIKDKRDNFDRGAAMEGIARHNKTIDHRRRKLAQAYGYRGDTYAGLGQLDDALADYGEAARIDLRYPIVYLKRGNVYARQRAYNRAIDDFTEAIRLLPKYAVVYNQRGRAYFEQGEYDLAIADFSSVIELHPAESLATPSPPEEFLPKTVALVNRGRAYHKKDDLDEALADLSEAIRLDPKYAWAYQCRGRVYLDRREYDRAVADFSERIRLEPNSAESLHLRGLTYAKTGQYDRAVADYNETLRLNPEQAVTRWSRGVSFHKMGRRQRAIADFNDAIRLNPNDPWPVYHRGNTHLALGDLDRAIADFDEAIQLAPTFFFSYKDRAEAHRRRGDTDRALADFGEAIRLCPNYTLAYCGRALVRASLGQTREATDDVSRAKQYDPGTPSTRSCQAWFLATCEYPFLQDPDQAIELADKATQQAPQHAEAWKALGAARYRKGDYRAARTALEKADRLGGAAGSEGRCADAQTVWLLLAMAHWQQDRHEEARRWFDKAISATDGTLSGVVTPSDNAELARFQTEAAELLGVAQVRPSEESVSAIPLHPTKTHRQ